MITNKDKINELLNNENAKINTTYIDSYNISSIENFNKLVVSLDYLISELERLERKIDAKRSCSC